MFKVVNGVSLQLCCSRAQEQGFMTSSCLEVVMGSLSMIGVMVANQYRQFTCSQLQHCPYGNRMHCCQQLACKNITQR
jgi:hypothetical protein